MSSSSSLKSVLSAACLVVAACGAQAQELRVAYVNSDKVMRDALPAQAGWVKFEAEVSRREKEINELTSKLKAAATKLDRESPTLPDAERDRRQRELIDQDRELQRKQRAYREDLAQRRNDEMIALRERVLIAVRQIAEQERYDLVVQEAFHASPRIDITERVIKMLNTQGGK
ncbi:OmpH family outer membrane protein [Piscinibacter sp. HJYY11]|uniref:OmpH family outer membrane protein n=1 Tax=Piscinibacter sp. HJYY11 TaxID=2801333 RepID=UPI00191FFD89|nr:OmpH family outer membrane protein [Piscinibacter sp. HJYY11]MBL0726753.1 OmpH family outer membrane protein [Piscinibacter sp. HJYY11]